MKMKFVKLYFLGEEIGNAFSIGLSALVMGFSRWVVTKINKLIVFSNWSASLSETKQRRSKLTRFTLFILIVDLNEIKLA
jgi:hypothetical protein